MLVCLSSHTQNKMSISFALKAQQMEKAWSVGYPGQQPALLCAETPSLPHGIRAIMQRCTHIQRGSSIWAWWLHWFRVQLGERLPFTKKLSFPTQDCLLPHKSAGDFFFLQCALNSYSESTDGAPCACRATKGIQCHWKLSYLVRN